MFAARQALIPVVVSCAVFAGCDAVDEFIPTGGGAAAERKRQARQQEESEARAKVDSERASLRQHLEASCRVLEAELAEARRKSEEQTADRGILSARIREISSASAEGGRTPERHVVLSGLLDDDMVNALALKYMDRDFRLVRLEFIEAMRAANARIRRRDDALNRNQADFDRAVSAGSDTADQSRQKRMKSMADLRRTIAELEKKERALQRAVSMSSAVQSVRLRKENELRDVSNRLRILQREYDEVRTNRQAEDLEARAALQANRNREDALRLKERADALAERGLAGLDTPAGITSDCEARTVGELERRIVAEGRNSELVCADTNGSLVYIRSIAGGLDKLDQAALRKVRSDVDARLSGKPLGK